MVAFTPLASAAAETPKTIETTADGKPKMKGFKKWPEVIRKLSQTEGLFVPFLQSAYAYECTDGKFYLFFESAFAVTLLTEERKQKICHAINAMGYRYVPADIIGSHDEGESDIRKPIDDLTSMEEADVM